MNVEASEIVDLLVTELGVDEGEVDADSRLGSVDKWDSLGHLRLCMAVESKYGVQIPADSVGQLLSVQAIVDFLRQA